MSWIAAGVAIFFCGVVVGIAIAALMVNIVTWGAITLGENP